MDIGQDAPPVTPPYLSRRIRACKPCRTAKVRCSGGRPCDRCKRRRDSCVYLADENYVSVPEQYLRDLQRSASRPQPHGSQSRPPSQSQQVPTPTLTSTATVSSLPSLSASDSAPSGIAPTHRRPHTNFNQPQPSISPNEDYGNTVGQQSPSTAHTAAPSSSSRSRNPLVDKEIAYVQGSDANRLLFLGPTSTWTFCRRAFTILEEAPNSPDTPRAPLNLDGAAFRLQWQSKPSIDASDLTRLPPLDYALLLYNTVKFHLGELFCIIDETRFFRLFDDFHKQPLLTAQTNHLWFVEYLLILAFGKAFTYSPDLAAGPSHAPPGSDLAARALSLLPDVAFLQDDRPALLAIEVLSLAALYFHSIDMRSPAYQYIGQALRLSLHDGLHRSVSDEVAGPDLAARCSNTWWAMYVLDQEITAGLGCPPAVPQNSITTPPPVRFSSSMPAKALALRTRLSRLVSNISNFSCGFDDDPAHDFVRNTTAVLRSLADLSRDLDEVTSTFKAGGGELPKMFYNTALCHHHCIVLATRPLVIWLLFRSISPGQSDGAWRAGPIAALLETSARSATTMMMILVELAGRDMLETFLQFQLEYAFSSAMLLSILSVFLPIYVPNSEWRRAVSIVFEEMARKGNVVVGLRKAELEHLETLLEPYRQHVSPLAASSDINRQTGANDHRTQAFQELVASYANGGLEQNAGMNGWNDAYGDFDFFATGADDILALAQEFEHGDLSTSLIFD